ncbi:MAG: acyltransferase [gamma proteobacterium symbiont of Bathyaustriella thionipta]|nr:acyltransferase [gamma proteobacterium symbiont of Bathyaustriella thionipta]MCU7949340.1 acyltransferase [gamma proteobacterium symbiont of Bathyaustriella thionipta]MCU7952658.1 acyltransferase [gamma proteobacterium symbiont of Bathyaustriella thionipta]MCU7955535.1 acyltransferase [gamma proteobacterium symbiont of Bathyaustriella thionipta]MCU7968587.1 acyltransferase [gamma proteobacterium symbiont of Bathyaustriella thionipta]
MAAVLSKYTDNRDNNFNLIRFIAATIVLYFHSFPLALGPGFPEPVGRLIGMPLGGIAVDIFFVTSGFLIASSFFSRKNIIAFICARVLRIYPALIMAVIFCVFFVGLFFTTNAAVDYFSDPQTVKFFKRNVTLFWGVKYDLPGVFSDNPFKNAVNGSLWTLPYEVKMYSYLAIIGSVLFYIQRRFSKNILKITFLSIAILAVSINIINHFEVITSVKFSHLFSMFFVGAAFYLYRDNIYLSSRLFLLIFMTLVVSIINKDLFFIVYSILLPYMIFYIAYVPSGNIRTFNKAGDYSYGIYIYAFPVQQSIAAILPGISVFSMVLLSFGITFALAFLSWHLIEKKFLKMKGSYVLFEKMIKNVR